MGGPEPVRMSFADIEEMARRTLKGEAQRAEHELLARCALAMLRSKKRVR